MLEIENKILPEFPRTMHLPLEPNATSDDRIATIEEVQSFLSSNHCLVTEKLDGANCGISIYNDQPLIRNRTKILNKNHQSKGKAKLQFVPIWTWFYNNKHKLEKLSKMLGYMPSVYGEWLYASHTLYYDSLPDWFIAYDIYNPNTQSFLDPFCAETFLREAGFFVAPFLGSRTGGNLVLEDFLGFRDGKSKFSTTENREGVYIKFGDDFKTIARFKMVNPDFKSSDDWPKTELIKNKIFHV